MFPLKIALKPSKLICAVVGSLGLVLMVACLIVPTPSWVPTWLHGLLAVAVAVETARQLWEHGLRRHRLSLKALSWMDVHHWRLWQNADSAESEGRDQADVKVDWMSPWMITLSFPSPVTRTKRQTVWIAKDSVPDDVFRQLSAGLRLLDQAKLDVVSTQRKK